MEENKNINSNTKKIAIIGAGISGLSFANNLKKYLSEEKIDIKIDHYEGNSTFGGRVRSLNNFTDYPMELGAEEVHGDNSDMFEIVKKHGGDPFDKWNELEWYVEYKEDFGNIEDFRKIYPEVEVCVKVNDEIYDTESDIDFQGLSVMEYFKKVQKEDLEALNSSGNTDITHSDPNSRKADHIIESLFGVECSSDAKKLCPQLFKQMEKTWLSGTNNYVILNKSYTEIFEAEFKDEICEIKYNTLVKTIELLENNSVKISDINEKVIGEYDYVISSLPVPILREDIIFKPELSKEKKLALEKLDHDHSAKFIVKFKEQFWTDDMGMMFLDSKCPYWWPSGKDIKDNKENKEYLLTGMTSGENCAYLDNLYKTNKQEFLDIIIKDLNRWYNFIKKKSSTINHQEFDIRDILIDYNWYNWKNNKYSKGGYTYHTLNEGNVRDVLREDHFKKVFFCGDAIAPHGHISTVHGGYESGKILAKEIFEILKK